MARHTQHLDTVGGVADVGIADRRSGMLVDLPQPDLHLINTAGLVGVGSGRRRAGNADVIRPRLAFRAGQHHAHAGIAGIDAVNVLVAPIVPLQGQRGAEQQAGILDLVPPVVAAGQHVPVGVEQFDHGVQREGGAVELDPNLASGVSLEAVDVDVVGPVERDRAVDLESHAERFVPALVFVGQLADPLRSAGVGVGVGVGDGGRLGLAHDRYVAVVAEFLQLYASPGAGRADGIGRVVGVQYSPVVGSQSGADRVVGKVGEHHRMARLADHLDGSADAVVDFQRAAGGRQSGVGAAELDDQALVGAALKPQSAVGA